MDRITRRHFLAGVAASPLAIHALRGQTPELVPIPGLEVGEPTKSFALSNVTVIDGTGQPARPGMTVVIADNRIHSLQLTADTQLVADVQIIDASGKFLIPGLWDMHAHGWPDVAKRGLSFDLSPLFVPNGITGIRMMAQIGGAGRGISQQFVKLRTEIRDGKRLGPRMVVASQSLADAQRPMEPEGARLAVRNAVQDGADFIKVHNALSKETYFAIVGESKKLGVPFVGHVPKDADLSVDVCAKAGQKSFEHMAGVLAYLGWDTTPQWLESLSTAKKEALYDVFRKNNSWLCPTLVVMFSFGIDPRTSQDSRWLKYVDGATKRLWVAQAGRQPPDPDGPGGQRYRDALRLVGALHRAGVNILAGTDTIFLPEYGGVPVLPGFGLHDELRHLVLAGLSPMDALRTATYKPAEFFGLIESLGTVERGKLAELVLLDANPLDDITNTTKISMVFTGGRVYRKPALEAMLNAVEANARNGIN